MVDVRRMRESLAHSVARSLDNRMLPDGITVAEAVMLDGRCGSIETYLARLSVGDFVLPYWSAAYEHGGNTLELRLLSLMHHCAVEVYLPPGETLGQWGSMPDHYRLLISITADSPHAQADAPTVRMVLINRCYFRPLEIIDPTTMDGSAAMEVEQQDDADSDSGDSVDTEGLLDALISQPGVTSASGPDATGAQAGCHTKDLCVTPRG